MRCILAIGAAVALFMGGGIIVCNTMDYAATMNRTILHEIHANQRELIGYFVILIGVLCIGICMLCDAIERKRDGA